MGGASGRQNHKQKRFTLGPDFKVVGDERGSLYSPKHATQASADLLRPFEHFYAWFDSDASSLRLSGHSRQVVRTPIGRLHVKNKMQRPRDSAVSWHWPVLKNASWDATMKAPTNLGV